jgi:uncharacterized coiled-coil protein SlyX
MKSGETRTLRKAYGWLGDDVELNPTGQIVIDVPALMGEAASPVEEDTDRDAEFLDVQSEFERLETGIMDLTERLDDLEFRNTLDEFVSSLAEDDENEDEEDDDLEDLSEDTVMVNLAEELDALEARLRKLVNRLDASEGSAVTARDLERVRGDLNKSHGTLRKELETGRAALEQELSQVKDELFFMEGRLSEAESVRTELAEVLAGQARTADRFRDMARGKEELRREIAELRQGKRDLTDKVSLLQGSLDRIGRDADGDQLREMADRLHRLERAMSKKPRRSRSGRGRTGLAAAAAAAALLLLAVLPMFGFRQNSARAEDTDAINASELECAAWKPDPSKGTAQVTMCEGHPDHQTFRCEYREDSSTKTGVRFLNCR